MQLENVTLAYLFILQLFENKLFVDLSTTVKARFWNNAWSAVKVFQNRVSIF